MIELKNVTKHFNDKVILENENLFIESGERVTLIGPSGCGKSTMLRLIIGLQPLNQGSIKVEGVDITRLGSRALAQARLKFGMVFQSSALFDSHSVGENVAFALRQNTNYSDSKIKGIVAEKLEMVGLSGIENKMPSELSGGMQKRVAFARAIAADPKILLYDEPTTGLDPITSTIIENLINKLSDELGVTSVIVTHQISTIYNTSDRIIMMHHGKLIPVGTPSDARITRNAVVHRFLNGIVSSEERNT